MEVSDMVNSIKSIQDYIAAAEDLNLLGCVLTNGFVIVPLIYRLTLILIRLPRQDLSIKRLIPQHETL